MLALAAIVVLATGVATYYLWSVRSERRRSLPAPGFAKGDPKQDSELIVWADELVGRYADLLERNKTDVLMPESALPGSVEDIKRALVITAVTKLRNSLIKQGELDIYRTAYMLLMNVVPDDQAQRSRDLTAAVQAFHDSPAQSDAELERVLARFAKNSDLFGPNAPSERAPGLLAEFETRLAKLVNGAVPLSAA